MKKSFLTVALTAMTICALAQPVSAEGSQMTFRFAAEKNAFTTDELADADAGSSGGLYIDNYTGIAELRMILCSDAPVTIEDGKFALDPNKELDADGNIRHAFFEAHSTAMYTQKSLIDDDTNIILWAGKETGQADAFHANGVIRDASQPFLRFEYRIPKGTPAGDYVCNISQDVITNKAGFIEEDLTVSDSTHQLEYGKDFAIQPITISVYTRGDVNCDGTVSIEDAQSALNLYVEQGVAAQDLSDEAIEEIVRTKSICAAKYAADASMNGELDTADPQGILDYYVQSMSGSAVDWNSIYH